ncbi:SPOR domain-containing protein [Balneolaceae bacterium ANBcel3]|nr:SPOR domain-containing protein [Balneolaceae bacterium ANBcel3]
MAHHSNHSQLFYPGVLLALAMLFSVSVHSTAQASSSDSEYNRWSIQLHANNFLANTEHTSTLFLGRAGADSRLFNPGGGVAFEFALSPSLALKAEYNFSLIENASDAASYRNQYHGISLGMNVYFMELFNMSWAENIVNPYFSVFGGQSYNDLTNMQGIPAKGDWATHYGIGFGSRFRLAERIDWTLGYKLKLFNHSGIIDGGVVPTVRSNQDHLSGFTTGISFKLGSTERPHAQWYTSGVEATLILQQIEELALSKDADFEAFQRRLGQQDQQLQMLEERVGDDAASSSDLLHAMSLIVELEKKVARLEEKLEEGVVPKPEVEEPVQREEPSIQDGDDRSAGFYVQTFASNQLEPAERALERTVRGLTDQGVSQDSYQVHIYRLPRGLYAVQIGPYDSAQQARSMLEAALRVFDDAYIHNRRAD